MEAMKRILKFAAALMMAAACTPSAKDSPFGWATCTSLEGGHYEITGGAGKKGEAATIITLKSNGKDMRDVIVAALKSYDIVILDGSDGIFPISTTMHLDSLRNKTIVGVNGAHLRSIEQMTPEILEYIEANKDKYMNDAPDGRGKFHMPFKSSFNNANRTAYAYRRALYDYTGDREEKLCHSGMFSFNNGCENIIMRNLAFEGTGVFRSLADNMIRITTRSNHIWIDHCSFTDPSRCCLSYASGADFVTVSRCIFCYTERSGKHTLGILISSSDHQPDDVGHLNMTIANCYLENVWARQPMGRYGHVHVLNNYHNCVGGTGINPRTESTFLIEGNYFEDGSRAFCRYHIDINVPAAYQWKDNRFGTDDPIEDKGEVTMPYAYSPLPSGVMKEDVLSDVGPVLSDPLRIR